MPWRTALARGVSVPAQSAVDTAWALAGAALAKPVRKEAQRRGPDLQWPCATGRAQPRAGIPSPFTTAGRATKASSTRATFLKSLKPTRSPAS